MCHVSTIIGDSFVQQVMCKISGKVMFEKTDDSRKIPVQNRSLLGFTNRIACLYIIVYQFFNTKLDKMLKQLLVFSSIDFNWYDTYRTSSAISQGPLFKHNLWWSQNCQRQSISTLPCSHKLTPYFRTKLGVFKIWLMSEDLR